MTDLRGNYVHLLLPPRADDRLVWASEELMSRLRLPWTAEVPLADEGAPTLAVGIALPEGACGVELLPSRSAEDPYALAAGLAGGTLDGRSAGQVREGRARLCVDLPGAFEAWLGRTEETVDKDLDEVGRVKHSNSSLARGAGDAGPVVELLAELVFKLLERAAAQAHVRLPVRRNAWPEGKAFAVHLSHDMDVLGGRYQLWRRYAGWSARYLASRVGGRREQARRWLGKIHRYRTSSEDHQYTVPRIVDLEGRYGATSSFYFFCSRTRRTWGRRAARMYRLTDPIARDALGVVKSAGSEIGVHAFPGDSCSPSTLARRKELIESVSQTHCVGVRQHYLCLTVPHTWRAQSEAGFGYDATLGWPRNVAMRAGTCLPFVVWDPLAARSLDLYEIPLIAMDGALVVQSPDPAAWLDELRPFIDVTGKHHGVLSLLTHPDRFDEVDYPGQNRFYEMFLQEMKHRGAWLTSGAEIWKAIVRHRRALRRGARSE